MICGCRVSPIEILLFCAESIDTCAIVTNTVIADTIVTTCIGAIIELRIRLCAHAVISIESHPIGMVACGITTESHSVCVMSRLVTR